MFQDDIKGYYANEVQTEWRRLVRTPYNQLELHTSLHFIEKHFPTKGLILDGGGGPGRYTIELAKRGFDLVLLDFTPELLNKARRQIRRAKVQERVKDIVEGSITDLSMFESNTFDGVLSLGGALSHLLNPKDRKNAIAEFIRVAKVGALIFVSVIGRLHLYPLVLTKFPEELLNINEIFQKVLDTGDYEGGHGFTAAHFFLPEELQALFQKQPVQIIELMGLEGLVSLHDRKANKLARHKPEIWSKWWDFHLKTCTHPVAVGISEHFGLICRKKDPA